MTQNEKELLLKDLCGRLPYGVVVQLDYLVHDEMFLPDAEYDRIINIDVDTETLITNGWSEYHIDEVRPYLFPMSSMSENQRKEYEQTTIRDGVLTAWTTSTYDWLNANHFDYRGLIEKGLAVDCTNLNIY